MSILSAIRNSKPITILRNHIPHSWVNTLRHYPTALLAAAYYQYPSRLLFIIGITGSDGKTTTTNGIYHLLQTANLKTGMLSTISAKIGNQNINTGLHVTTPDPWPLQKLIKSMVDHNAKYAVLETTSHGWAQHRLFGTNFDIGVITNITHEHFDYHGTYQNYLLTKAKLLKHVKLAVLNIDDKSYQPLLKYLKSHNPGAQIWTYGIQNPNANFLAKNINISNKALNYTCYINERTNEQWYKQPKQQKFDITFPILAYFNVYNTLAMIAVGHYLKIPPRIIQKALKTFPPIPGRMEYIPWKKRRIVIDFAHTPNAIQSALETLRQNSKLETRNSKLISVFGCAGLRDIQKRPLMGKVSAQFADITIITAEDPRTEDVNKIIAQIATGCKQAGAKETLLSNVRCQMSDVFIRIPDRQTAITTALAISHPGDTIGIFGKGHEKSMCYGATEHPWSDKKAVQKAINAVKSSPQ